MPSEPNAQRLDAARYCVDHGNLAAADILCRDTLDSEPESARAYSLLGTVAARLQDHERAAEYLRLAVKHGGGFAAKRALTAVRRAGGSKPEPNGPRYLVIKSWAAGFWSNVNHVVGGLILAEITGRLPIVWWGKLSLFGDGTDRNAFEFYFEPVSGPSPRDIFTRSDATFFPSKWTPWNLLSEQSTALLPYNQRMGAIYFLNRPETVAVADFFLSVAEIAPWIPASHHLAGLPVADLYRYAIAKYLRPVPAIVAGAEQFIAQRFGGAAFAAAHLRGSDKAREIVNMEAGLGMAFDRIDAVRGETPIFIMTDDQRLADQAAARYGARAVMTDCRRTGSDVGTHFLQDVDRRRLGEEVMRDVYIALGAARFVGLGASNLAAMVSMMRPWPTDGCELIGEPMLLRRSAFLYLPRNVSV
jgi:protein O-GlcNAc transferase